MIMCPKRVRNKNKNVFNVRFLVSFKIKIFLTSNEFLTMAPSSFPLNAIFISISCHTFSPVTNAMFPKKEIYIKNALYISYC